MDRNKRITKPKYEIIKEALLERIRTGQFSSDAVFCTEKMLSEQYEVSRITAKRAIEDLEQQGILCDSMLKNKDGSLITEGPDRIPYTFPPPHQKPTANQKWFPCCFPLPQHRETFRKRLVP